MIEFIQQHHPDAGETSIRKAINRAQDDLSSKTGIIQGVGDETLELGKRYYDLDPGMLEIKKVQVDNITIKRLLTQPIEGDID